jgi:hypothetical protein
MLIAEFYRDSNTLNITGLFDNEHRKSWLQSDFAKEVIKDVDNSELVGPNIVVSPVLGGIPVTMLSGGVKALLLAYNEPDMRRYSSLIFGDNCTKWLLKAAEDRDITLVVEHPIVFPDKFEQGIYFKELDKTVYTFMDFFDTVTDNRPDEWGGDFPEENIRVRTWIDLKNERE